LRNKKNEAEYEQNKKKECEEKSKNMEKAELKKIMKMIGIEME
jgi:hypothetical protein